MNSAKDSLFLLVHSLSVVEKRAFRRYCQDHLRKGSSLLLQLFEAILTQEKYDVVALTAQFDVSKLSAAKNRLYTAILKFLARHHTASHPAAQQQQLLHAVHILLEKKLHVQALKLLRSLEKKAQHTDDHRFLLQVNRLHMHILTLMGGPKAITAMEELAAEHRTRTETFRQEEALHVSLELLQTLTDKRLRHRAREGALEDIAKRPEVTASPLSFLSRILQVQIRAVTAISKGHFPKALAHYKGQKEAWESRPELIPHHSELYMRYQLNQLNACIPTSDVERFQAILQETKGQFHRLKGDISRHQRRFFYVELIFCLNFGNENQGVALLESITTWLDGHSHLIEDGDLLPFLHNCAIFHFLHSNFRSALPFLNRIRNIPKTSRQEGIQTFAPILEIILHYELGNHDYIDSRLRALTRNPRKLSPYHKRIAKFFKAIFRMSSPSELREGILELQENLDRLAGRHPPTGHYEIRFWLESRLRRVSVRQIYQEALRRR